MSTTNLLIVLAGLAIIYLAASKLGLVPDLSQHAPKDETG